MTSSNVSSGPPHGDWLGTPHVRFERHGSLARCIVDRPAKRNAMTAAMYFAVRYAIDLVNRDDALSGLLLTGSGDVFIPGGDMSGTGASGEDHFHSLLGWDNTPFEAVRLSRKPVVSAVNGITQGGGLMIAMLSDVAVASERATFRAPELLRGIPDTHYGQILPRQIGPARARDLLMTGRVLTAGEAERWGLITRVVAHDELLNAASEILAACCRTGPNARTMFKMDLDRYYGRFNRLAMESTRWSEESAEGFAAFKARRPPSWIAEDLLPEDGGRL
jgi:enoyl-CoA hydratase